MSKFTSDAVFNVSYYLRDDFKSGGLIIDPTNLETTQEYYLLENLAVSLLRKNKSDQGTLKNTIINQYKIKDKKIVFELNQNLFWSDGTRLTCEDVLKSISFSLSKKSRHITAIKSKNFTCSGEHTFTFSGDDVNLDTVLFELGLADLAILKLDENLRPRFDITSGAYFVSKSDPKFPYIELTSNPYFKFKNTNHPKMLRLFDSRDLHKKGFSIVPGDQIENFGTIDFMAPQGWGFAPATSVAIEKAQKKETGIPNMIHFFFYVSGNKKLIKRFASELYRKTKLVNSPKNTAYYTTMIPNHYSGNIPENPVLKHTDKTNHPIKVALQLHPGHQYMLNWFEEIKSKLLESNIHLNFYDIKNDSDYDLIFGSTTFKGNMADPTGSWAFLLHKDHGPLKSVSSELLPILDQSNKETDENEKNSSLEKLHELILKNGYAIPFLIESTYFLMSNRVLATHVNIFDMRVRFYEFEVK